MKLGALTQKRLAFFITEERTGKTLRKIPVYAEIVVDPSPLGPPELNCGLFLELRNRNRELADELARQLAAAASAEWLEGNDCVVVSDLAHKLEPYVEREVDDEVRAFIASIVSEMVEEWSPDAPPPLPAGMKIPLGVLGSDHAGFASFDLERLRLADLAQTISPDSEVSILAYPMLRQGSPVAVLDQGRIAADAIVGRLTVLDADPDIPIQDFALNLPAMQNAGLIDWRLSPGSFAAVPQTLLGADGCETLLPGNFAVSTFHLRYVIRLNENYPGTTHPRALVNEYAVSFIPIGHSLGQIQYSLPLAPGESVRLAVIDWRRADTGARTEDTAVAESLLHEQSHDRLLTETMNASLDEWQRGGSVMGGTAGGAGMAGSYGMFSGAAGSMTSIGGGYSTSSGSRELTADTQQKVADSVAQATTSVRELHSSVVVQTTQEESEHIQTRAFANFNRGHTLTVLYYEVLRHFRLVSELTRQYEAVLLPRPEWDLRDDTLLLDKRYVLDGTILDTSLLPAFDALLRADGVRAERTRNPPVVVQPASEADIVFTQFKMFFTVGNETSTNAISMHVHMKGGAPRITLTVGGSTNLNRDDAFDSSHDFMLVSDPTWIRWGDIDRFEIRKESGSNQVRIIKIDIVANPGDKYVHPHVMGATYDMNDDGDFWPLAINPPAPAPPATPIQTLEQAIAGEDYARIQRLKSHLSREEDYYRRVLDLSVNPNYFAREFETAPFGADKRIDHLAPHPLEVFGSNIAFPTLDQSDAMPPTIAPTERLISLPTRGLFAEAKLGHCAVAEEIDETRFWRWDEHPLPFTASDIDAVQPIQPAPQQAALTPTALPAPVAIVQAPAALPDPTGLAALLAAITKPDVFRDMSLKEQVGKLLTDLIEGSVDMAQAAVQAGAVKKKMDDADGSSASSEAAEKAAGAVAAASREQAEQQKAKEQQVTPAEAQHAIQVAENQADKGLITKTQAKEVATAQVQNIKGSTPAVVAKRVITFTFKYDTGSVMWGDYQITIMDLATSRSYIPDGTQKESYFYQVPLPTSVKGPVLVSVTGFAKSHDIAAPSVIEPKPWSMSVEVHEQFASMTGVSGFNVVGQTRSADLEFTLETEDQTSTAETSSHEFGVSVKAGGTIKVVEVEAEGSYKYTMGKDETKTTGKKQVRTVKMSVLLLDRQKQPKIEPVK